MPARPPAFQTRAEFEQAHDALMSRVDGEPGSEGLDAPGAADAAQALGAAIDEIREFLDRGARGGAYLYEPRERRSCQSILDFWASRCYSAGLLIKDSEGVRTNRVVLAPHDPALLPQIADDACPYMGLDAFTGAAAGRFFGREDDINALLGRLQGQRLVIVTGASGSGKSSLVLAGLMPALRRGALADSADWLYVGELVPGSDPLTRLAGALANALQPPDRTAWIATQAAQLLENPEHAARLLDAHPGTAVLIVDQFEEALTLRTAQTSEQYQAFVANLLAVAERTAAPHRVILTMRKNVESQLARDYPELNVHYRAAEYPVHAMDSVRLREAIEKPAALVGLKFQASVVVDLVKSVVGEDAGLPLLQFSLMALWARRSGNLVTHEAYQKVGDPRKAMADAADSLYRSLPPEQQQAAVDVFVALARLGEDAAVYRNRVSRGMLYQVADAQNVDAVLDKFSRARLLRVTVTDPHERRNDVAEVAHESLLRNWDMLRRVFTERRAQRERRAFLRKQADKWRDASFDSAFLLEGLALQQAREEIRASPATDLEREFLDKSAVFAAQRENAKLQIEKDRTEAAIAIAADLERARRDITRRLHLATAAAIIAVALAGAAFVGSVYTKRRADEHVSHARDDAQQQTLEAKRYANAEVARAQERAASSIAYAAVKKDEADRALERATRESELLVKKGQAALAQAEQEVRKARQDSAMQSIQRQLSEAQTLALRAHDYIDTDADLSVLTAAELVRRQPAATASMASVIIEAAKFRRASTTLGAELLAPVSPIDAIALDPAGEHLAVGNADGVDEWAASGAASAPSRRLAWDQPREVVNYLAYSPDGRHLAAATQRGVLVWDLDGGAAPPRRLLAGQPCRRLHFSPDSRYLTAVQSGGNSGVHVWQVGDGAALLSVDQKANPGVKGAFDAFFSDKSDRLMVLMAPEPDEPAVHKLEYAIKDNVVDRTPVPFAPKSCKSRSFVYASGGARFGIGLLPELCLMNVSGSGSSEPYVSFADAPPEGLTDIMFDDQSRFVVELFGPRHEARVIDLATSKVLRLQGAFDLPDSMTSYEQFVSMSHQGNRLAIKGRDGSVRLYELAMVGESVDVLGATVWIDPSGKWVIESVGSVAHPKFELRDAAHPERRVTLDPGARRIGNSSTFALGADQRWLVASGTCEGTLKPCLLGFDLQDNGAVHELPFDAMLSRMGDLTLLQMGNAWEVHQGTSDVPAFRMAIPPSGNAARSRDPLADSVEIASPRLFAVKSVASGKASVDVCRVAASGRELVRTIERPAPLGMNASLLGEGRLLLLDDLRQTEVFDLRRPGDAPILALPGRRREVLFSPAADLLLTRRADLAWEVRRLAQPEVVQRVLPKETAVDAQAGYTWQPLPNGKGIQVMDLAGTWAQPLAIEGSSEGSSVTFSRRGGAMLVNSARESHQRIYGLPKGDLLFDADQPTYRIVALDDSGRYMRRSDGRFIPIDAATLIDLARRHVHRELSDEERCRILSDWQACGWGRPATAPAATVR